MNPGKDRRLSLAWRCRAVFLVTIIGCCVAGCAGGDQGAPPAERVGLSYSPNVLLVVVDTLRADHLSTYGYVRQTSPRLDQFAEKALVFDNAYTMINHTLPAHVSLMTGVHPATHHVLSNGWTYSGPYPMLAEMLRDHGYDTAAFVSGFPMERSGGLDAGFDVYMDTTDPQGRLRLKFPCELTNNRALRWLKGRGTRPFFLFVHYFDVHPPFGFIEGTEIPFVEDDLLRSWMTGSAVDEDMDAHVLPTIVQVSRKLATLPEAINAYDNEIYRVDGQIARLLAELRLMGVAEETLIIITSDHGEGLGQHSYYGHGLYLYEEQLRVPLIVRPPRGVEWEPRRVEDLVSLLDIAPMVLDLAGLPMPPLLHGRNLIGYFQPREGRAKRRLLVQRRWFPAEVDTERSRFDLHSPLYALRGEDSLKLHLSGTGAEELYDLGADPLELRDLAKKATSACVSLRRRIEHMLADRASDEDVTVQAIDDETREMLRSLGYIQ